MLQEKLHRPKERKRFEYSPSLFFLQPPPSFHLCLLRSRHAYHAYTHACVHAYDGHGVVITLAIWNVTSRGQRARRNEGSSPVRFKSISRWYKEPRWYRGPFRLISAAEDPG